MDGHVDLLKRLYADFNARNIDGVLAILADDVVWANGMDGGHVQGRDAVRAYWTRQWAIVSPHVEPVAFDEMASPTEAVDATGLEDCASDTCADVKKTKNSGVAAFIVRAPFS